MMSEAFKNSNFVETLARYYSEFLSTDFKKSATPSRQLRLKDQKERRVGIRLETYSSFVSRLRNKLNSEMGNEISINVKPGKYKANLPKTTQKFLEASIQRIDINEFHERAYAAIETIIIDINKKGSDIEKIIDFFYI